TMLESPGHCTGVAFRVAEDEADAVLATLDHRERGGYTRLSLQVDLLGPSPTEVTALTYVTGPDNPNWLGPAPRRAIAHHIARRRGPSGTCCECLIRLAESNRELAVDALHSFALEREIEELTDAAPMIGHDPRGRCHVIDAAGAPRNTRV